jgi:PqqD family protein of HPr-rel-A system
LSTYKGHPLERSLLHPVGTEQRWRFAADTELVWRSWGDDEHIVYYADSGDTHQLNAVAAEVIRALQQQPATAEQLAAHIASTFQIPSNEELTFHIGEILANLAGKGLVERAQE